MENHLLPEEQIITKSQTDEVVLTTYRLRCMLNDSDLTSIMLDQISGIRVLKQNKPWLLGLGALCLFASAVFSTGPDNSYSLIAIVAAGVFVLLYFATRSHVITISSSSMSIIFQTKGMKSDEVLAFVNQVEDARKDFLKLKQFA
jgi:hypothetical protein